MSRIDPYRRIAVFYDALIEPALKNLRAAAEQLVPLHNGMRILDVGCGTGTFMRRYAESGVAAFGIDRSASMLGQARDKLKDRAPLSRGDAERMPYRRESFDLLVFTMALHEMSPETRTAAIAESRRILTHEGRVLVIDYHAGPTPFPLGVMFRCIGFCVEFAAGGAHFRNYRHYMSSKGLNALASANHLTIERRVLSWQGNIVLAVLKFSDANET